MLAFVDSMAEVSSTKLEVSKGVGRPILSWNNVSNLTQSQQMMNYLR